MGINQIEQLEIVLSKNPTMLGVAFVGRSNVGKSSLINSMFGRKTAKTSKTPGRTREINIFSFEISSNEHDDLPPFLLFDLPGYGHAEVSKAMAKNWDMLMTEFFTQIPNTVCLYNIQDARHPNQKADQQFHEFLKQDKLKTVLVLNKIDKLKKQKDRSDLTKALKQIKKEYTWVEESFKVSAESNAGLDMLEQSIVNHCLSVL